MAEAVELPTRLAILPFRNKVLLPGAIIRIRCTSPSSVKLVEQELWQREEKGLIGVLPVRDAEAAVGSVLTPGIGGDSVERIVKASVDAAGDSQKQESKSQNEPFHWHNRRSFLHVNTKNTGKQDGRMRTTSRATSRAKRGKI